MTKVILLNIDLGWHVVIDRTPKILLLMVVLVSGLCLLGFDLFFCTGFYWNNYDYVSIILALLFGAWVLLGLIASKAVIIYGDPHGPYPKNKKEKYGYLSVRFFSLLCIPDLLCIYFFVDYFLFSTLLSSIAWIIGFRYLYLTYRKL